MRQSYQGIYVVSGLHKAKHASQAFLDHEAFFQLANLVRVITTEEKTPCPYISVEQRELWDQDIVVLVEDTHGGKVFRKNCPP
jgi:hypothetical protein